MPNALQLFGITDVEHHAQAKPLDDIELLHFRDVAAIVAPAEYTPTTPTGEMIEQYRKIVEDVFGKAPVLPAPVGTVFRSRETLTRWLDLHYVTLREALSFVEDRAVARVHGGRVTSLAPPSCGRRRAIEVGAAHRHCSQLRFSDRSRAVG